VGCWNSFPNLSEHDASFVEGATEAIHKWHCWMNGETETECE